MAGLLLEALTNCGVSATSTREVLFMFPDLLFFVLVAIVSVDSSIGLVSSLIHLGREGQQCHSVTKAHGFGCGSGQEAHPRRSPTTLLAAAGTASLAALIAQTLLLTFTAVLEAPVWIVLLATAAAVATVLLAAVASVVVVATLLLAAVASAVMLERIYKTFGNQKLTKRKNAGCIPSNRG